MTTKRKQQEADASTFRGSGQMINPNQETSEDVLRRLRDASYERMRVELKCSIELLMKDFDMTWDDIGRLWGDEMVLYRADRTKHRIVQKKLTLKELNALAHIFSTEPYILFRPREPWTKT